MKKIYFYTVVFIASFFAAQLLNAQPASLCCPYIGWDYVVPITISNSTGANIPAQSTLLVVNTAAPIGAGKMQANGNDIRFAYNTCGNYLNYWIESGINTANTNIWVAMPAIPNGGSITLYMYYGNAGAGAGASAQTVLFPIIQTITGAQTLSGTITADWIDVNGATITAPMGSPLVLNARRIIFNGTYNANALGYGPGGGPGAGTNGGGSDGGSGGSYGGVGGSGGGGVSAAYGTANGNDIQMGSGGGGSDCNATAAGGGAISLIGSSVDVNGTINVQGQTAQNCCCGNSSEAAGGGAGGGVLVQGDYVKGNGTINANGGNGGNSTSKEGGGGGGGGRVKMRWCQSINFTGTVNVAGGNAGTGGQSGMQPGAAGSNTQPQTTTCPSIVVSAEQPVSIPTASFTYNNACTGVVTSFTNTTTLQSGGGVSTYAWDFGDGGTASTQTPTHSFANTGNFNVQLSVTSSTGCTDAVTVPVTVQQLPVADFNSTVACAGNATNFTDASTGGVVGWNWNFGDGGTDNTQNPAHAYASGGTYTVMLIAINSGNCADTIQKQVTVNSSPTASFNTANVCIPNAVQFNDASAGAIVNYGWSFGDGQISTQQSPSHSYNVAGTYNAILVVANSGGCADTATLTVVVNPKPSADFIVAAVCEGVVSSFADASTGNIINYGWSFGDGNISAQQNPSNTYASANTYNVTFIVQSDSSCYDTITKQAVVNPVPVVDFTTGAVCLNQSNTFSNTTTIASGSVSNWAWDFGDAQISSQQSPSHIYSAQGTYTVSLVATSDNGCIDSTSKQVDVYDKPVAAFTADEVCLGLSNTFTDGSSIATGAVVQWNYSFGDGQTGTTSSGTHAYATAGNFTAVLIVTSDNGCTDTAQQTVIVDPLPQVSFSGPDVCLNDVTVFSNTSTISSGSISTSAWSFGDGNSSTSQSPSNTYSAPGVYSVSLTETSDKNCTASASQNVNVFDVPVATATSTPACYNEPNGTAIVAVNAGTPAYTYSWSNGQNSSTASNLLAGNYDVTLTDANNCTATASVAVSEPVTALTVIATPVAPSIVIGEQVQITLNNSYNDAGAVYNVDPSYALSCTNCAQFDASPYQTITYNVDVTDANGCKGFGSVTVTVDQSIPIFVPNAFSPNGDGQNDTWGVYSQAIKQIEIAVFNRWGEKVFETDNQFSLWDGTYQGKPAQNGVYVYKGYVIYLNDKTRTLKGSVTLFR